MKFVSFGERGTRAGIVCDDSTVVDLTHLVGDDRGMSGVRFVISHFDELHHELRKIQESGGGVEIDSIELSAPIPDPSKIIAAPVNYMDHMTEMNQASHIDALGVFLKAPSSLTGHNSSIRIPYADRRFDQEGELCLVIGKMASHVTEDEALEYVFGYSVLLDITMRGGEDRSTRKSFDTFTPMGPTLVTRDEVGTLSDLQLRCWVNGELRQNAMISDLIWNVPMLVSYVSSVMKLLPGDVISTGTPKGVGPIDEGDEVIAEVSRVGRLRATVSATGASLSPTRGASTGALGVLGEKRK